MKRIIIINTKHELLIIIKKINYSFFNLLFIYLYFVSVIFLTPLRVESVVYLVSHAPKRGKFYYNPLNNYIYVCTSY